MEIDPSPVPPPKEYSDNPSVPYQSESSMNFDYLHTLQGHDSRTETGNSCSSARMHNSPRHFAEVGNSTHGLVDESRVVDRCLLIYIDVNTLSSSSYSTYIHTYLV